MRRRRRRRELVILGLCSWSVIRLGRTNDVRSGAARVIHMSTRQADVLSRPGLKSSDTCLQDKLTEPPSQSSSPAHRIDHHVQKLPSTKHAEYSLESTEQLASNPTGETFLEHRRQTSEAPRNLAGGGPIAVECMTIKTNEISRVNQS
jgi:hypothetical protein